MLSGFRFHHAVEVRFRDLDPLGHVNNAVYLTYLESARMAWWMHVMSRADLAGLDMILARAEIDYRSPVVFGERLLVGVRCASLKRSSFVLEQRVDPKLLGGLVIRTGDTVIDGSLRSRLVELGRRLRTAGQARVALG